MNLNEIIYNNRENKRIIEVFNPRTIHCDFELGIIGALKQVWPNSEIKLCLWHMFRNIELKRKKLFGDYSNHSIESYNIIKRIKTLVYIDPNYIKDVFNLILLIIILKKLILKNSILLNGIIIKFSTIALIMRASHIIIF